MIHRFGQSEGVVPISAHSNRTDVEIENPLYQVQDIESLDVASARRVAREAVNVDGALVRIYARTDNDDVDVVWDEDPDPTYMAPVPLKGFFVPQPLEAELTQWGVEFSNNRAEVAFVLEEMFGAFGDRLLRPGDLLEVPYNSISRVKPKYYKIENAQETGNYRYTWLYLTCQAMLLQGDVNIRPATDQLQYVDYDDPSIAVDHK